MYPPGIIIAVQGHRVIWPQGVPAAVNALAEVAVPTEKLLDANALEFGFIPGLGFGFNDDWHRLRSTPATPAQTMTPFIGCTSKARTGWQR